MESLIKALDSAFFELGEAFKGMPDDDLWTRPHPRLLSVGELAAHIAQGEASCLVGVETGPLFSDAAGYYTVAVDQPMRLAMSAAEVLDEVLRVHDVCKRALLGLAPAAADPCPHRKEWTWGYALEYQGFHVAYHTGQVYSVRHLLGHDTVDN